MDLKLPNSAPFSHTRSPTDGEFPPASPLPRKENDRNKIECISHISNEQKIRAAGLKRLAKNRFYKRFARRSLTGKTWRVSRALF